MVVSEIDEDFVDIINLLNENGFKPFSSCDGVLSHHTPENRPLGAYIAFLKSDGIIDLFTAMTRDNSDFIVEFSNNAHMFAYEYFGNIINGDLCTIRFDNEYGEKTGYFKQIITGIINGEIVVSDDEKEQLQQLSECLDMTENSELCFIVSKNCKYQPGMRKNGRTNKLTIRTRVDLGYERNMKECANLISKKFGIVLRSDNYYDENFEDLEEFIVPEFDNCSLQYFSPDQDLTKIMQIIDYVKEHEKDLSVFISREPDEEYLFDDDDDYYSDDGYSLEEDDDEDMWDMLEKEDDNDLDGEDIWDIFDTKDGNNKTNDCFGDDDDFLR